MDIITVVVNMPGITARDKKTTFWEMSMEGECFVTLEA